VTGFVRAARYCHSLSGTVAGRWTRLSTFRQWPQGGWSGGGARSGALEERGDQLGEGVDLLRQSSDGTGDRHGALRAVVDSRRHGINFHRHFRNRHVERVPVVKHASDVFGGPAGGLIKVGVDGLESDEIFPDRELYLIEAEIAGGGAGCGDQWSLYGPPPMRRGRCFLARVLRSRLVASFTRCRGSSILLEGGEEAAFVVRHCGSGVTRPNQSLCGVKAP
jgi:hypothetical protein